MTAAHQTLIVHLDKNPSTVGSCIIYTFLLLFEEMHDHGKPPLCLVDVDGCVTEKVLCSALPSRVLVVVTSISTQYNYFYTISAGIYGFC